MSKLKEYKFCDLYEMSSGISSKPEQAGHGTLFVSFKTVFNNYFLPEELEDLMHTSEKEQDLYSVLEGDVFLTRTSETLDELGMSSVAFKDYPTATYSGFLKRLRPIQKDITYHKFMAFYLRSKLFRSSMNNNAIMTLRASLNEQIFSYLKLVLPPYDEQKKIGDLLYNLYLKIELNNKINAQLEAMAKTLYDYWFVQFDFPSPMPEVLEGKGEDNNSFTGKPYKSSGGKMVWNEELKREIPEGWEVGTFGDYCKSTGGFAFKASLWSDKGLKVVKIKDIQEDYTINLNDLSLANITSDKIDKKFMAVPGSVLIAMTGATVGKFAIVPYTNEGLYVNQRVGYFNLGDKPIRRLPFLINSLNQKYFREAIFTLASGAAQPNISNEQINNVPLVIPDKKTLDKYNAILASNYNKILINQKQNQTLSQLRDWLLPMLMNGQVKVGGTNAVTQGGYPEPPNELGMVAED
ncbi:MAG: restriction endonuclease subunit S [Limnohabitans sp.]|nr:restriction endonuclease subunit S [Limnohabitans sp.]